MCCYCAIIHGDMKTRWRVVAIAGVAATVWYRSLPCGYEASSGFLYDLREVQKVPGTDDRVPLIG